MATPDASQAAVLPDRAVRILLVLIVGGACLLYLTFFHSLAVPNPDFFDYRSNALRYLEGSLPTTFKRMPVFPLLIALISLGMPGPEPERLAAEVLNFALAPLCLWLIFRIARSFLRAGTSLAVVALCAVHRAMVHSVAEPMQEITILASVLLVVHLALRGSPWAYAAAFVASLTRHEAVFTIPLLVLHDLLTGDAARRRRCVWWGLLASLGAAGWMLAGLLAPVLHPYLAELAVRRGDHLAFIKGTLRIAFDFLTRGLMGGGDWARRAVFLAELALLAGGATALLRRAGARAVLVLGLLGTYVAMHMVLPLHIDRYAVPILWIVYLLMAAAIESVAERAGWLKRPAVLGAAGVAVAVCLGASLLSTRNYMTSDRVRLYRIQFRRVGEWYGRTAQPGDRMVVQYQSTVRYYSGLPQEAFMPSRGLESESPETLLDELRAKGITYAVWDNQPDAHGYTTKRHKTGLLLWLKDHRPPGVELVHHVREGRKGQYEAMIFRIRPAAPLSAGAEPRGP